MPTIRWIKRGPGPLSVPKILPVSLFADAFDAQEWAQVFSGNRTRLQVVGFERFRSYGHFNRFLPNVSSLVVTASPLTGNIDVETFTYFITMLPNVEEIDLSNAATTRAYSLAKIMYRCHNLQRLYWTGACITIIHLTYFSDSWIGFTELCIDDSRLELNFLVDQDPCSLDEENLLNLLFRRCRSLERLSIRNVTWAYPMCPTDIDDQAGPLSQEMLIKMVRRHPTLRWLRSDLSEENIAMLQRERPEITFVSE